jgi:DNA-binding CsgD family transcriptional regulator
MKSRPGRIRLLTADVDLPGSGPFPIYRLTEREVDIICLVAFGLTNVQVAQQLHISHHTVAQHMSKILRQWGAQSRCELVARAYAAEIINSWPPRRAGSDSSNPAQCVTAIRHTERVQSNGNVGGG